MTGDERDGGYGYINPCVVCGAAPFRRCVVPRTGRKTDTHMARVRGVWPAPSDASTTSDLSSSTGTKGES